MQRPVRKAGGLEGTEREVVKSSRNTERKTQDGAGGGDGSGKGWNHIPYWSQGKPLRGLKQRGGQARERADLPKPLGLGRPQGTSRMQHRPCPAIPVFPGGPKVCSLAFWGLGQ